MFRIVGMDDGFGARRRPYPVGGAGMIAVGQDDSADALTGDSVEICVTRFDRIDTDIAAGIAHQMAVEIIAVGFGKPRPGLDTADDLAHVPLHFSMVSGTG